VLVNRVTNEPLFVVVFTLLPKEDSTEEEGAKASSDAAPQHTGGKDDDLD
jgi:hypothetical protein